MPFTIPNEADAGNSNQAEPDSVDFDILTYGSNRTAVISGCAVSAQGTPDMTVAVAAGGVEIAGEYVAVTAGNGTITAADGTNPRFDLVTINTSGTIVVTAGTAAASPVFPAHPADVVVLAAVYVAAGDTAIGSTEIVDKRMLQPVPPQYTRKAGDSRFYLAGVLKTSDSSVKGEFGSTVGNSDGQTEAQPLFVSNTIDIIGYGITVTTASDAAVPLLKFCIYDDVGGFPGAVVSGTVSGTINIGTTGIKTVTITAVTLTPGIYWVAALMYDVDDGSTVPNFASTGYNASNTVIGHTAVPASGVSYVDRWLHKQAAATSTFPDPWTSTTVATSGNSNQSKVWVQIA